MNPSGFVFGLSLSTYQTLMSKRDFIRILVHSEIAVLQAQTRLKRSVSESIEKCLIFGNRLLARSN